MIKFGTDGWRAILNDGFTAENVERVTLAIGKYVYETSVKPGVIYSYRIAAFNDGGKSFPSEVVSIGTPVDGIYGKKTAEAVSAFQEKYGLAATGEVDDATFHLLFEKFEEAREERTGESELIPAVVFPLQMGDSGSYVRILQSVLDELLGIHIPKDGFFGRATEDGIRALQRRYRLPGDGRVTRALWGRIVKEYRRLTEQNFS